MKPSSKLRRHILQVLSNLYDGCPTYGPLDTEEQIDHAWDLAHEADDIYDAMSEVRGGDVETNVKHDYSRHYEAKSVAAKMDDGTWIGWTYWYGGGKHGEPEAIEWVADAYELDCKEEQKLVTVRTFTVKDK